MIALFLQLVVADVHELPKDEQDRVKAAVIASSRNQEDYGCCDGHPTLRSEST
jgi:hypothetical protein